MRTSFLTLALLLALAACAGQAPPPDLFHRIEPAAAARFAKPPLPGVLEVQRLATDGVLAERAITFAAKDDGPLSHYAYDLWSEPPGVMLQDRLTRFLADAGAADRVVPPELGVLADWTLRGKLRRFEHLAGSKRAVVDLELGVVSSRDGSLALLEHYSVMVATQSSGVEAAATAMEQAVSQIFAKFLADLGRARTGAPAK